jgi:hypothetical protein
MVGDTLYPYSYVPTSRSQSRQLAEIIKLIKNFTQVHVDKVGSDNL